jgi:protein-S-isoprenylcysteine O-methyltransferase Ste14
MEDKATLNLKTKAFLGLAQLTAVMALVLFLAAGTWRYAQGWIFLLAFSTYSLAITLYLMRHDPQLLARRVTAGPAAEERPRQKVIQALASAAFLSVILVPALDHRFSWSRVPLALVVLGEALMAVGFLMVFLVFKENTFASAIIEVGAQQEVIDTGPYAWVRHPMYAGALILLAGIPLALGSFWGLLTLVPFIAVIVWRLREEEAFLSKQLSGYDAYCRRIRHRLIPGVW